MRLLNFTTAVLAITLPAAAQYQPVTLFRAPDAIESFAAFCYIGDDGTVTGHRLAAGDLAERGYVMKKGEFELLELVPGSDGMLITGITGKGDPIGFSFVAGQPTSRNGVIWRNGIPMVLPEPPVSQLGNSSYFFPQAANNQEAIVGYAVERSSGGQVVASTPMMFRNGAFTPLPPSPLDFSDFVAINDRGDILLQAPDFTQNPIRYRIFLGDRNGYQEIQIPNAFQAIGMDSKGTIAGVTLEGDYIVYADGAARVIPKLLGASTGLRSLNQKGQSCGIAQTWNTLGDRLAFNFVIGLR